MIWTKEPIWEGGIIPPRRSTEIQEAAKEGLEDKQKLLARENSLARDGVMVRRGKVFLILFV